MSHTTSLARGWVATHNGDYSGDVTFFEQPDDEEPATRIPFDILVELVAEAVRTSAIANLEDADTAQLIPGLDPHFLTGGPEADAARAEQTTEVLAEAILADCDLNILQDKSADGTEELCYYVGWPQGETPGGYARVDIEGNLFVTIEQALRWVVEHEEQLRTRKAEQTTKTDPPLCAYCGGLEVFEGVCRNCRYDTDTNSMNEQRCVEISPVLFRHKLRCPNDALGTSQHCADHQRKHTAVEDESVSEPRCAVCLEPTSYPIHIKAPTNAS